MSDARVNLTGSTLGFFQQLGSTASSWLGVTSTLVATATAVFTTQLAVGVNQSNARDRFFDKQLEACLDLGDASLPLQGALNDVGAGYLLKSLGQPDLAKITFEKGGAQVQKTYSDYQKIMTRLFVLYPDSFVPLQAKIGAFTPTTLKARADASTDPSAAFQTLHDGFSNADIKLRASCTDYLRRYAKANLIGNE